MNNKPSQQNHRQFYPRDVAVRATRFDEFPRRDRLMKENLCLGFKQFAGRSLRYVAENEGKRPTIAGWQSGAPKCRPRNLRVGWKNLHLIGNSARFQTPGQAGEFPNPASCFLPSITRR